LADQDHRVSSFPYTRPSYSAKAEYPVRRGFAVLSLTPLEYWITRFRG
jgi:hypothetical protein